MTTHTKAEIHQLAQHVRIKTAKNRTFNRRLTENESLCFLLDPQLTCYRYY